MPVTRSSNNKQYQPVYSSTPHSSSSVYTRPAARPSIHEKYDGDSTILTPIKCDAPEIQARLVLGQSDDDALLQPEPQLENEEENQDSLSNSNEEDSQLSFNDLTDHVEHPIPETEPCPIPSIATNLTLCKICVGILICAVAIIIYWITQTVNHVKAEPLTLKDIQNNFPLQSQELWLAIKTSIEEVDRFNKPSVFLLLYEKQTEKTIRQLVPQISKFSQCKIRSNCSLHPITMSLDVLNSQSAITDYGNLISEYKHELEDKGVMAVYDIDKIQGKVAQIFHSMCDEFTPLVDKAVYIFTMRAEKFPELTKGDISYVEDVLRNNWRDLKDDIFEPLFTRISSLVLRIFPEK